MAADFCSLDSSSPERPQHFGTAHFVRDSELHDHRSALEHLACEVVACAGEVSPYSARRRRPPCRRERVCDVVSAPATLRIPRQLSATPKPEHLEQVGGALSSAAAGTSSKGTLTRNLQGERVFSSFAAVEDLDWVVFIERPADEVYRPLWASIRRTAALLLVGLGMALLASLLVARRILRPLQTLRHGVEAKRRSGVRLQVKTGESSRCWPMSSTG